MNVSGRVAIISIFRHLTLLGLLLASASFAFAEQPGAPDGGASAGEHKFGHKSGPPAAPCEPSTLGSPYIPVDSWVYPAVLRLYSLGYVDSVYLGMRPWTRASLSHMLDDVGTRLEDADGAPGESEAEGLYEALMHELSYDAEDDCPAHKGYIRVESAYTVARGMSGTPLRDSYHLGSTIVNDYGRPYASGFNNYTGASGYASVGRFLLYVRGEFQGAPSTAGYSQTLAGRLAAIDGTTYYFKDR